MYVCVWGGARAVDFLLGYMVCTHTDANMYTWIHKNENFVLKSLYVDMHVYMLVSRCACICACVCMNAFVCMHVCLHLCVRVYACLYL